MSKTVQDRPARVSRRDFMKAAGLGAASVGATTVLGSTVVANAAEQAWDTETDVIAVGSGGAALAGAIGALQNGAKVIVLEKAPIIGGTTAKSGGQYWIPNSPYMQAAGLEDPKDDALRYMARLSFPVLYKADNPTLGMTQEAYNLIEVFYDNGSRVAKQLHDTGALVGVMSMSWDGSVTPDYFAHLPENKANRGRTILPMDTKGAPGFGVDMIRQMSTYVTQNGGTILTEHRVIKIILDETGRVVGLEVDTPDGSKLFRARKGVVFGSGGFTQNPVMRSNYLRVPVLGGCAVPTNQGDLVTMAIEVGAKLGNMNEAYHQQEILEEVLEFSSVPSGAWLLGGDSMIVVNKHGNRIFDEKFVYNERTRSHVTWNPQAGEYVNLYQFMIFDEHARAFGGASSRHLTPICRRTC